MAEQLFARWHKVKEEIKALQDEEERIRQRVKTAMTTKGLNTLTTPGYQVTMKTMTRESLSKKDCPAQVWSQYCKKSSFPVMKLVALTKGVPQEEDDEDM